MTPTGYTEDALVEQPAIKLLAELGWETVDALNEFSGAASSLGRETKSEVILTTRLRLALVRLNPDAPPETIEQTVDELTRDRSSMSSVAANKEIYRLLKNGVRTTVIDSESNEEIPEIVRVIDWENPTNNDFLICSQFSVTGEMHTRRPDLIGFVNGLPLVFIELKATYIHLKAAYDDNLRDYKDTIPQLFWANALIILSNGSESRMGSMTASWEHLAEWKKVDQEEEQGQVSLETMLRGVCEPRRLLDLVENFTLFKKEPGGMVKLVAKNHQYLGVNKALQALTDRRARDSKLGVFWHTQGSGKSVSMIFFAQKVQRKLPGNWSFVIVTDRKELDKQIYKNFASAGAITEDETRAESSANLRQLLSEDHRYIFTLIHKFREAEEISSRDDIIVITDEAHRSQYDTLALNMRTALPNAAFMAFTGTPLIQGEEKTKQVFGDYISTYNFRQSVLDGATVPLYYENRIPELQLINKNFNKDVEKILEEAELDEAQEQKLERVFGKEYHLITRDERLETIAKDVVAHFTGRGFPGKAMMICIDKATAVRMYDKVRTHWTAMIEDLRAEYDVAQDVEKIDRQKRIDWMVDTDMAVVVSQGQNEIADLKDKGLDIRPHRKRMVEEDLETKFKSPDDPFRLVFVCAMWITGFDVPSCSTLYLDKPMRNHTLMQAIARANRVYPGKTSGLILDYVGVFHNLEKALAIYGGGGGDTNPVEDKSALVAELRQVQEETRNLCRDHGVDLSAIHAAVDFVRIKLLDDAVEALVTSEAIKRHFLDCANRVKLLYKAILPDPTAQEFVTEAKPVQVIAEKIRALVPLADISPVMQDMENLLDRSIAPEGYTIGEDSPSYDVGKSTDLSSIDFEELEKKFNSGHQHTEIEKLKGWIGKKLEVMVQLNRTRIDYMNKFQTMIDAYNAGSLNAEKCFQQLRVFANSLNEEEQRKVSEQLSEEELAIFDLLTKPDIEMSDADRNKVKVISRDLLNKLKAEKLVLDWRKRQQTRAAVRVTIETLLDEELPSALTPVFEQKTSAVFQHVCEAYYGEGQSIYR